MVHGGESPANPKERVASRRVGATGSNPLRQRFRRSLRFAERRRRAWVEEGSVSARRRFPVGAEVQDRGASFRVWAPKRRQVTVVELDPTGREARRHIPLDRGERGYHAGFAPDMADGALYGFLLDEDPKLYPDPASRFQPQGPHGPSQLIDGRSYVWNDTGFRGAPNRGHVIYQMHIGTFTHAGSYAAAMLQLPELSRIGITTLQLMPIADFPGAFGWGFDGVNLWAPTRLYGNPTDLRRFIDVAHQHDLCVVLDVVYDHLGPEGNFLKCFSDDYFTNRYQNDWGDPVNFDGDNSAAVREYFAQNARYWIEEYHFDGLRLGATQNLFDQSERHIIEEIIQTARDAGQAERRHIYVICENEPAQVKVVQPADHGGYGADAVWNDDFHRSARVALTGRREGYYHDYTGSPQELMSAAKWGFLYQGQYSGSRQQRRGTPSLRLPARHFITYIQNHHQIANSLGGARCDQLTSPALLRAMTTLFLLIPATPMLFQGQEFTASAPFLYFADHDSRLSPSVNQGRKQFLAQFQSLAHVASQRKLPEASEPATFERCKLDFRERETHREWYLLHRDLLALRHGDPAFVQENCDALQGAVLSAYAFVLRFFCPSGDRLMLINLGPQLDLNPCSEPLLAPPQHCEWRLRFCSEHPKYGGEGYIAPQREGRWELTAYSSSVFAATPVPPPNPPVGMNDDGVVRRLD